MAIADLCGHEIGSFPPPWAFSRSASAPTDAIFALLFVPVFSALWGGLGLAWHPRVTSPGAFIFRLVLRTERPVPLWRLAALGVFAYYGTVIPLFRSFASDLDVHVSSRAA